MFRNLARRNQSLLQRQLTVLDDDGAPGDRPGRARRPLQDGPPHHPHAAARGRPHHSLRRPPGRSWSSPGEADRRDARRGRRGRGLRPDDGRHAVARGAGRLRRHRPDPPAGRADRERDYPLPAVHRRSGWAARRVANGFAIEIEDRGLGMVPQRLAGTQRAAGEPPDINPANTEQLGLFVVGQLARRHRVSVMLRPSPYGGTTAVVLIPARAHRRGRPGRDPAGRAPAAAGTAAGPHVPTDRTVPRRRHGATWILRRQPATAAPTHGAASARPGGARPGFNGDLKPARRSASATALRRRPGRATRPRPRAATRRAADSGDRPSGERERPILRARCGARRAPAASPRPAASARVPARRAQARQGPGASGRSVRAQASRAPGSCLRRRRPARMCPGRDRGAGRPAATPPTAGVRCLHPDRQRAGRAATGPRPQSYPEFGAPALRPGSTADTPIFREASTAYQDSRWRRKRNLRRKRKLRKWCRFWEPAGHSREL